MRIKKTHTKNLLI